MDGSSATLWAALIAAVLSAVSVVVGVWSEHQRRAETRHQELTKWVRERLHIVAIDFLNSAFSISGRTRDVRSARLRGRPLAETQKSLDRVHRSHTTMRDALTSLSLIAPAKVIAIGERVHYSHHALINFAFGADVPSDDAAWTRLRNSAKRDREEFLTALREPLGLDPHAATIAARARSSWRVPADQIDPAAQD